MGTSKTQKAVASHTVVALLIVTWLNVWCLSTAHAEAPWEEVVGNGTTIGDGFGNANNYAAVSMAVFGDRLFVGAANTPDDCEVWCTSDGTTWEQCSAGGFGDSANNVPFSMAAFGNYLYVGVNNVNGCEVWRTADGPTWEAVVGGGAAVGNGFGYPLNLHDVTSMAVFGSYLYVGTDHNASGCTIWRTSNGTDWVSVVGDDAAVARGFGDPDNRSASSMVVRGSDLYVGTSRSAGDTEGCEVWRTENGTDWEQIVGGASTIGNGFGDAGNSMVFFNVSPGTLHVCGNDEFERL